MAFLAPLFLAGLAALAVPVLLHLRRSRPKQTVPFSTLMFLEESPPVTRTRARLQDILLLILRCLAIALLILAFARPFFPAKTETLPVDGAAMNLILIDTSASMRGEPSERAARMAETLINGFPEKDWIAVASFSDRLHPLLDPERARTIAPAERKSAALEVLSAVKPDWKSTRLDAALLAALAAAGQDSLVRIHLVSDLQKGSELERLRGEVWPGLVQIIPHPVVPADGWTNAGIRMMPLEDQVRRVRVSNSQGSEKSDFTLTWGDPANSLQVSVPPGESAVFDAPSDLPAEGKVMLTGDDFAFDNETFWVTPVTPVARIWCPEQAQVADTNEVAYFLNRALQSTPGYTVEITAGQPKEDPALTVFSGTSQAAEIRELLKNGSNALFTLRDATSASATGAIIGSPSGEAREAAVKDHALFGEIDFRSAVFSPFADARYSDFSSIRVWKYRILPPEITARGRVLARFDSGDPAWLAFPVGSGTLHVLTTTWRPQDSQLALTTKFPPLLHSLLSQSSIKTNPLAPLVVGDSIIPSGEPPEVTLPDGSSVETKAGAPFTSTDIPGIYRTGASALSVQLAPAESELTPLPKAELRSLGLPLDPPKDIARSAEIAKQESDIEQESQQRLGWWLLVAAAGFLLLETLWAGIAGKRLNPATP